MRGIEVMKLAWAYPKCAIQYLRLLYTFTEAVKLAWVYRSHERSAGASLATQQPCMC